MSAGRTGRTLDLLIGHVTEGLPAADLRELEQRLAAAPELDGESFELAAAAVELAYTDVSEPLPAGLRERLARQAESFYTASGRPGSMAAPNGEWTET